MAPRPNLIATARPTVDTNAITFDVPDDASVGDVLVVMLVADSAVSDAPDDWVQVSTAAAGGHTWSTWTRSVQDGMEFAPVWAFAGGAADPGGFLLVYDAVGPGTVIGPLAAATVGAGTAHTVPAVNALASSYEELAFWYTLTNTVVTPPASVTTVDEFAIADAHAQRLLVGRVSPVDAVPTLPTRPGTAAASTAGRMLALVIRDGMPPAPAELVDPVPGNVGLTPS